MIFNKNIFLAFGVTSLASQASADCTSIESITCVPVTVAPTLDANTDDWSSVEVFEAPLTGAMTTVPYPQGNGNAKIQCVYDAENVYFLFEVPGSYRFSTEDNHLCAAVSTMFKMGEEAELFNMGGCPLAEAYECESAPEGCAPYKVDIGGHWELRTTTMGELYGTNNATGNDLVANNDDEYAVSPYCRFDDDDAKAANEWSGAWNHTNAIEASDGSYIFEMSRSLTTASNETDAQLKAGTAIDFGFAFWDPLEMDASGWTDSGHYVTGCSADWISLRLVDENGDFEEPDFGSPLLTNLAGDGLKDDVEEPKVEDLNDEEEIPVDAGTKGGNGASANGKIVYAFSTLAFASALIVW